MLTYTSARQCFAMTALPNGLVPRSATLVILRTRYLFVLISSCIHEYATSMRFNFPIPCRCRMCSVAYATVASTGFNSYPKSFTSDTIPFDSDAPNSAVYRSASALLFAMILCLRVYACRDRLPNNITPALHNFQFLCIQPNPESVHVVTSFGIFPYLNTCP